MLGSLLNNIPVHQMLLLSLFAHETLPFGGLLRCFRHALLERAFLVRGFFRHLVLLYEQHESLDVYRSSKGLKIAMLLLSEYRCLLLWLEMLNALHNVLLVD